MDAIKGVIVLVISNRPRASSSFGFEITRAITPWIALHSVQLLLLIVIIIIIIVVVIIITISHKSKVSFEEEVYHVLVILIL